ncbi:MAG: hypothetical protein EOM52_09155, partial [Clostridia bacterium]|nr:hypothetical protein [Clostridia bacterium]
MVIQLQTADNVWQTISEECYATLDSGTELNLSKKNVSGSDGQVLMDFSKIVLDPNSSVENTPLTADLLNLKEDVIPHFDITAESGKAGASGTGGTNGGAGSDGGVGTDGVDGESGTGGMAGSSGSNGGAGASGTNGAGGSSGSSGSNGQDGALGETDGNVLNFPVFTMENWTISATSCSGTIKVTDKDGMLRPNDSGGLHAALYVVDTASSTIKASMDPAPDFSTLEADGYAFEFTALEPDRAYRLVVSAPINTGADNAQDYVRDFISKSFWTDSAGVYLESGESGVGSLSLGVYRQTYAPSNLGSSAVVYLFNSLDAALSAVPTSTGAVSGQIAAETVTLSAAGGSVSCGFRTGLRSNTTYYARVVVQVGNAYLMPEQVLALTTLKTRAVVGAPTLTSNRGNWGFDVTPGAVYDPDKGITGYAYEFYNESDVSTGAPITGREPVKTVRTSSGSGLTVPLDGLSLAAGKGYYVRAVASFNDNEKTSQLVTLCSNLAKLDGSKLPSIYFVNSGSNNSDGDTTSAADTSAWYDQLVGKIIINPGVDGSKVLLNASHHPVVTFRASGYYYVQYSVYLDGTSPTDGSGYLVGRQNVGGYIEIDVPAKALQASTVSTAGAVNGLRPDTQYRVLVTGDLSDDGQNAYESNTLIGTCVVKTPSTVSVRTAWTDSSSVGSSKFSTTLKLSAPQTDAESAFGRQMTTVSSLHLALISGTVSNPGKELASLTITNDDAKDYNAAAANLGDLMTKGLTLDDGSFGLKGNEFAGLSAVHITLSQVNDYTVKAANRLNQKAYQSNEPGDTAAPPSAGTDGAVYVNEFKITGMEGATHEIRLSASPDPIPNPGEGLTVTAHDDDKDGVSDNSYTLKPNYLNTGRLAQTITFYAFDYPDFHADYTQGGWTLSGDYPSDKSIPLTAATAVDSATNHGVWLAKLTLDIPASTGKMPSVRFIPQSAQSYYTALYAGDTAQITAAVAAYQDGKGGVTDESGAYLLFYDGNHQDEPSTGHQFVYAWTLTYKMESETTVSYYPFSLKEYTGYQSIPYSKPWDAPRHAPDFYALPWSSDKDGATWSVYLSDPQGVLVADAGKKAALYARTSAVSGIPITDSFGEAVSAVIFAAKPTNISSLFDDKVTIPQQGEAGSTAVSARVQWYTDKYTNNRAGLFAGNGSPNGYTADTCRYSKYRQTGADGKNMIPYYSNVFTFYHDSADFAPLPVNGITVQLQEQTPDDKTEAVNHYKVTLKGPAAAMKKIDGLRLHFKPLTGDEVILDKYLEGVDSASVSDNGDGTVTVTCNISLSGELGTIAGQSGVQVSAKLLYESGEEGFDNIANKSVALRSYRVLQDNAVGWKLQPSGRYRFNAAGVPADNPETDDALIPRMGSFFRLNQLGLESVRVTSTRHSTVTARQATVSFALNQAVGAGTGTLALAPRTLAESSECALTVTDKDGKPLDAAKLSVPKVTPVITYTKPAAGANNLESEYSVTGSVGADKIQFLLQKKVGSRYVIQVKDPVTDQWIEADPDITYENPVRGLQTVTAAGHLSFSGLDSDTTYRVTAFYLTDDGKYAALNMFTSEGREVTNFLELITSSEPTVTLQAYYGVGSYYYKRIYVDLSVSKAVGFYYTLELRSQDADGNWQMLTYLDSGDSLKAADGLIDIYDIGAFGATPGSAANYLHQGALYKAVSFNPDGTLNRTRERIYLDYGGKYQVRVRVYN